MAETRDSSDIDPQGENHEITAKATRRGFLLMTVGLFVAGCASPRSSGTLPGPTWRTAERPAPSEPTRPSEIPSRSAESASSGGVIPRSRWAGGRPVPSRMDRMTRIRYITVHHDGMGAFYDGDESSTSRRIESIRRVHCDQWNWGDIGYHYIIDRNGRVWHGRPLQYQGAHVRNHNEGNIGVLALGNFDEQSPSQAQQSGVSRFVSELMREHGVPVNRVMTHMEWSTARTACPGRNLQDYMVSVRNRRQLG